MIVEVSVSPNAQDGEQTHPCHAHADVTNACVKTQTQNSTCPFLSRSSVFAINTLWSPGWVLVLQNLEWASSSPECGAAKEILHGVIRQIPKTSRLSRDDKDNPRMTVTFRFRSFVVNLEAWNFNWCRTVTGYCLYQECTEPENK